MAVSEIIGAAVGVLLLVIVAYVVVGSTLFAAETVTSAQKDLTLQQEARIRSSFSISDPASNSTVISANITNTGSEIISDFKHMDVIVYDTGSADYRICTYDATGSGSAGRWEIANRYSDFIHPYALDPQEKFQVRIITEGTSPLWFQITTANGVSASAYV